VCFAFVPIEKRTKLEDSGIKCRFLGFGDDYETEEIKGYRLLTEDGQIVFSDNVVFPNELKFERLDEKFYTANEDKAIDDLFDPFIQTDSDLDSKESVKSQSEALSDEEDYFTAEEENITESETSNVISLLDKETWWRDKGVEFALIATLNGIPITIEKALSGPDGDKC